MKIFKFLPCILIFILFWSCQGKRGQNKGKKTKLKDSIITIRKLDNDITGEYYNLDIHQKDYSIIQKLKSVGQNLFVVSFYMSYTNKLRVSRLIIKELEGTGIHPKLITAKKNALKKIIFSDKTAFNLPFLEQLKIYVPNLANEILIPSDYKQLKVLVIKNNPQLKTIHFQAPMEIEYLYIPRNNLSSINSSFQNLIKLKRINLFENQLEDLDLGYIPWIRKVDISDNPIPFDKIDSLRLKYPKINIVSYSYKKKRPGNYIDRSLETPVYE